MIIGYVNLVNVALYTLFIVLSKILRIKFKHKIAFNMCFDVCLNLSVFISLQYFHIYLNLITNCLRMFLLFDWICNFKDICNHVNIYNNLYIKKISFLSMSLLKDVPP